MIKDKNSYCICRCEEVSLSEICDAIEEGATTIDSVKRQTRAGMGLCQGRTCQPLVARLINRETGLNYNGLEPFFTRQPFRPLQLEELAELGNRLIKKVE